MLANKNLFIG